MALPATQRRGVPAFQVHCCWHPGAVCELASASKNLRVSLDGRALSGSDVALDGLASSGSHVSFGGVLPVESDQSCDPGCSDALGELNGPG